MNANLGCIQIIDACIADSSDDAPPVGVRGKQCSLDQWGMCYGVSDIKTFITIGSATHRYSHKLGSTFAIADDTFGQRDIGRKDSLFELFIQLAGWLTYLGQIHLARGDEDAGVVGGCMTIDRDAIEGFACSVTRELLQQRLCSLGLRGSASQHGCHIRVHPPRTLSNSIYGNGFA